MGQEYRKVSLLILLCLISYGLSVAQSCISMSYDANGNRVNMIIKECDIKNSIIKKDLIRNGVPDYEFEDDVLVYPNPNNGILNIKIDADSMLRYEISTINGLFLDKKEFYKMITIDIRAYPSGTYLLRIIGEKILCSKIIVKL